jgi:hypothetical protein
MNRTKVSSPGHLFAIQTFLSAFAFIQASCSGGPDPSTVKPKVFEQADLDALKKKAKTPADLRKALQKEIFAPDAVPVPAKTSAPVKKKNKSG